MRRLLPAAIFVLLATLGAATWWYTPIELKQFTSSAVATAVYLSNFWFAELATDYLASDTNANPLLHTWSLSVEEQFYLVWPLLLLAACRLGRPQNIRLRLTVAMLLVAITSLMLCIYLTQVAQPWAFFGSPARAWEFAVGGTIALSRPGQRLRTRQFARSVGILGGLVIVCAAIFYTDRTSFPGYAAILPVLGAALIILAAHTMPVIGAGGWLSNSVLRFTGDISYSLYLWHWPVFVFLRLAYREIGLTEQILGILISIGCGWLTYHLVENPIRFGRLGLNRTGASISLGVVLTGIAGVLSFAARDIAISRAQTPNQKLYESASKDIPRIYPEGCHLTVLQTTLRDCTYGDPKGTLTVILFGDSHAAQWFPALEALAQRRGWRLVSLTKSGCPSVEYPVYLENFKRSYHECATWRRRAIAHIRTLQPALTIFGNSKNYASDAGDAAKWATATQETVSRVVAEGSATVLLRDTPWLDFMAPNCLARADQRGLDPAKACLFPSPVTKNADPAGMASFTDYVGAVHTIDMTYAICPSAPCSVIQSGTVLYHDNNHLTARFSVQLADALFAQLKPAIDRVRTNRD